jgi:hypothetical protein
MFSDKIAKLEKGLSFGKRDGFDASNGKVTDGEFRPSVT